MPEKVLTAEMVRPHRRLGPEASRNQARRLAEGFIDRYLSGDAVLDIGYRGGMADADPITPKAIGVELDYPGYDGVHLPFEAESQDAVFASHSLEHIVDYRASLTDWFRVLRIGGYLVIAVPHQHLYERKSALPSRFNGDHKRFYTPATLLAEIEASLPAGGYRIRSLRDIDDGFDYAIPPEQAPMGCYEIEMVVQKIAIPLYADRLVRSGAADRMVALFAEMVTDLARTGGREEIARTADTMRLLLALPLPPFQRLQGFFPADVDIEDIKTVLRPLVQNAPFDEEFYLAKYPDIREAVQAGRVPSGKAQFVANGYFRNRVTQPAFAPYD